jgi:hypothetical protein
MFDSRGVKYGALRTARLFAVAVATWAGPSYANDGFGALGAGGIVIGHTDKIAMVKEVLDISHRYIQVDYEFVNESDSDVTETVSFPLPPYSATPGVSGVIYGGSPLDFRIIVDRKPVKFETRVWANLNGKDETDRLSSLGFTAKQIALVPFEKSVFDRHQLSRPPEIMEALKAEGLVDEYDSPIWEIQVAYEWQQTFPAHRTVHISHIYRSMISEGTAGGYFGPTNNVNGDAWLRKEFCADDTMLGKMHQLYEIKDNLDVYGDVPGTQVKYVLITGNTWKDGIRDFTLRIRKGAPYEIVSLCFGGTFKKINGLTLEAQLKNFHPTSNLNIYFGNAWGYEGPNSNNPPVFDGTAIVYFTNVGARGMISVM